MKNWTEFSLKEQIGQMVVVRASGYLFDHQIRYPAWEATNDKLRHWLQTLNIGGVILLGGSGAELALRTQQLQNWATNPLFIAADIEEGVGQRFSGATWFPPPMALGKVAKDNPSLAKDYATQMGTVTAREAMAIGINWILAPVVDVNNNPNNPVINVRSFGDNPKLVSDLASAFIQGAKQYPVLTTAKHFPGHGDTTTDSHLDLPVIRHSVERLQEIELPPFSEAIAAGVDSIMSAHLKIPAWDSNYPATLSEAILTGQLRQTLGFQGLIVTDALIMGGVAKSATPEEIAVRAVEAGADILLMPNEPVVAVEAVYEAVNQGRLSKERIAESVERIRLAKQKLLLISSNEEITKSEVNTARLKYFVGWVECERNPTRANAGVGLKNETQPTDKDFSAYPSNIESEAIKTSGAITGKLLIDFSSQLSKPEAINSVKAILTDSMEIGGNLPLKPLQGKSARNLIVVDDLLNCDFLNRQSPAVEIPKQQGYELQLVDQNILALADRDERITLLQVFIRGNPFRGSAGLSAIASDFYQHLLQNQFIQGLIIYGSPYVLEWFRPQLPAELPWVFSYGQMSMAQKIACEALLGSFEELKQCSDKFIE